MKKIYAISLAALALAACAPVYETDRLPIIPEPEPEIVYEGAGKLLFDEDDAALEKSSYSWKADGDAINLNFEVDLQEYEANGSWEIGHFYMDMSSIFDFLGVSGFSDITDNFQAYDPDGTAVDWTSYAPGMWVDSEGVGCGWSSGSFYWQWYLDEASDHDYDYASHKGLIVAGGNPGNTVKLAGTTIVSKSKITLGERVVDFIVTAKLNGEEYVEPSEPEALVDYLTSGNDGYAYQSASSGMNQYTWKMDENGITVDVDANIPSIQEAGEWVYLMTVIDPELLAEYLDIEDLSQLADFDYFYPVDAEGNKGEKWTTGYIGNWVENDSDPSTWMDGTAYWFLNFGDNMYENHYTEGLLCIGTNPGNIADLDGQTVTSRSKIGDKDFIVNVHYHDNLLTSGEGELAGASYAWSLSEEGVNVEATVSIAGLDDSYALFGFPLNTAYVNDYFDITIEDLTIEDFYPVDAEGTPGEWTSYAPGQWFNADGSASNWSGATAGFWQYYTATVYDYNLDNLFYLGKNPGNAAENYKAGDKYVSKAKMAGYDFTVTINVVE